MGLMALVNNKCLCIVAWSLKRPTALYIEKLPSTFILTTDTTARTWPRNHLGVNASWKAFTQNVEHFGHYISVQNGKNTLIRVSHSAPCPPYGSFYDIKLLQASLPSLLRLRHEIWLRKDKSRNHMTSPNMGTLPIRISLSCPRNPSFCANPF